MSGDPVFGRAGCQMDSLLPPLPFPHGRSHAGDYHVSCVHTTLPFFVAAEIHPTSISIETSRIPPSGVTLTHSSPQVNLSPHLGTVCVPHISCLLGPECVYADGMIIVWAPSSTPIMSTYGSDTNEEEQCDKEFWKPRLTFR